METYDMNIIYGDFWVFFFWWFNGNVYGYGGFMVIFFRDFMVIEFYFLMEKYVMTIIYGDIGIGVRWNMPPHFKEPFYGDIMGI